MRVRAWDVDMSNLPTPTNPLVLVLSGGLPSMKNEHQVYRNKKTGKVSGIGRNKDVIRFLQSAGDIVDEQCKRQGFDIINPPHQVGAFVHMGVAFEAPKQDVDNMYTSFQETWQKRAIGDDRQVAGYAAFRFPVLNRAHEFSVACIWSLDSQRHIHEPLYALDQFFLFYDQFYRQKTFTDLLDQANTDVNKLHNVPAR